MIFNLRLQDFKIAKIVFSSGINTFCKITRPVNELVLFLQVKIIDILFTPYLVLLLFRNDDDDDYLAHFTFRHRYIIYLIYHQLSPVCPGVNSDTSASQRENCEAGRGEESQLCWKCTT